MNWRKRVRIVLFVFWMELKALPGKIKRCVWNKHILLFWYRLWIRKNVSHQSLDMDSKATLEMSKEEFTEYCEDLLKRRRIAERREDKDFDLFMPRGEE